MDTTEKQKFTKGDLVMIDEDLGSAMSHFESGCEAIVQYSYDDKYGGAGRHKKQYSLYIKGKGGSAWYEEHQLTLIESDRLDLLYEWEKERQAEITKKSDLDWIFQNGEEVLEGAHGASVEALGKELGIDNLWGNRGEGIVYYQNAMRILELAKPFLENND